MHFHGREQEVLIDIKVYHVVGVELRVAINDVASGFGEPII
jgi:hypothetical protein